MIVLDASLPPGALCLGGPEVLADDLPETAVWWHGTRDSFSTDPDTLAITEWRSLTGAVTAIPTDPNQGNGLIGATDTHLGVQCLDGVHCGLVAPSVVPDAQVVTLVVRYVPPPDGEARTVLTLNMGGAAQKGGGENYLFASEAEGLLTVKDDAGLVEITLPAPETPAARHVVISLDGPRLAVSDLTSRTQMAQAAAPVLSGPANLFIGCRNQRPRLQKTLGGALIVDVGVIADRALLTSGKRADRAALAALRRVLTWGAR